MHQYSSYLVRVDDCECWRELHKSYCWVHLDAESRLFLDTTREGQLLSSKESLLIPFDESVLAPFHNELLGEFPSFIKLLAVEGYWDVNASHFIYIDLLSV